MVSRPAWDDVILIIRRVLIPRRWHKAACAAVSARRAVDAYTDFVSRRLSCAFWSPATTATSAPLLVPLAQRAGHDVVGLDSDLFVPCVFGEAPAEIESIRKDVRDVEVADLEGFDAVLHLAAVCNDPVGDLNPQTTYDINQIASAQLAAKAKQAGVSRFVFFSSCSLYGKAAGLRRARRERRLRAADGLR